MWVGVEKWKLLMINLCVWLRKNTQAEMIRLYNVCVCVCVCVCVMDELLSCWLSVLLVF